MEVDAGEHLGVFIRAVGIELDTDVAHLLTAFLEDGDDVVGGAAAGAGKHRLHRPRPEVAATALYRPVHYERLIALGFCDKADIFNPLDSNLHYRAFPI